MVVGTLRRDIEAGRAAISVKLSRKARRRMKAAGRVKLRLRAAITDSAGNDSSGTVALTLRR